MIKQLFNTDDKRRLISNFFSLVVLRGFQFLIPLVTLPYLVRIVGIEKFGLINFALSLGLYFGAIIQFGFGVTATREIARNRSNPIEVARIYSSTLMASVLLALICMVLYVFIVCLFDQFNQYLNLYLSTLAFIVFQNLFPIWFFQGMERMKYITYLTLLSNVAFLVLLFIFVKEESDFLFVPLFRGGAAFLIFIFSVLVIKQEFNIQFKIPFWSEIKYALKEGRHAFVSQLAPNLYNNSAVFMLGLFTDNLIVGLYTAATKVIDAVISFGYILSNTFLPYLSRNIKQHALFQKIMLGVGSVLTVIIFTYSEWIVKILFSANNIVVAAYIQWLALTILFGFIYLTYNTNYLMIKGNDRVAKNISLYVSIFAFFWTFGLIYYFGLIGAVVSILLARLMLSAISFYFYVRLRY